MPRAAKSSSSADSAPKKTASKKGVKITLDPFYNQPYDVLKKDFLNFFDPTDNSNKFYAAELHQNANGEFRYFYNHGRVGSNGTPYAEAYDSLRSAEAKYEEKVREKLRKGYQRTDLAVAAKASNQARTQVNADAIAGMGLKVKSSGKSSLPDKIATLVNLIYREANRAVSYSISGNLTSDSRAPLGNLGINGIRRGREILQNISQAISRRNVDAVRHFSAEFFRTVPRSLGSNLRNEDAWMITTHDKVQSEMDILDLYEDSLRMLPVMGQSEADAQYAGLGCDLGIVDNAAEFKMLYDNVYNSRARNHDFRLKVVNAYHLRQHNAPKFDASPGNVQLLYHGSRNANLVGILSSHLKLPTALPNSVHKAGAMFGPGIYFASESTKSANYAFARFGGTRNLSDNAFLFVAEVALGRVFRREDAHYHLSPPSGYDSVHGAKGRSLVNDEFIVYRPDRLRLKYLVEVERVRA